MKYLLVGDVHAKPDDLEDCGNLIRLIVRVCRQREIDTVIFLGDQYHTHAIVNVEVQRFWIQAFKQIVETEASVIALVGNHDRPGDRMAVAHAMQVHSGAIKVIDSPIEIGGLSFVSYCHDQDEFIAAANSLGGDTLICHQTFDGASYDNGFFAKDAIDPNKVTQKTIISGHIHTPGKFGKVWYPGAPRWQTVSDANIERAIWVLDGSNTPVHIPTGSSLRRIWNLSENEVEGGLSVESQMDKVKSGDKVCVDLVGSQAWCTKRKLQLKAADVRFRIFATDLHHAKVKESDGLSVAFKKFFDAYKPKNGTDKDVLASMVKGAVDAFA